ncbi:hypothetical protein JCM6882_002242 [Rhodosporidiobolus microsporus]
MSGELLVTTTVPAEWVVEGSALFGNHGWFVKLAFSGPGAAVGCLRLDVVTVAQPEDYAHGTATEAWVRYGAKPKITVELLDSKRLLDNPATTDLIIRAEPFPNSPASYILASQGLLKARWPHFHTLMNSGWNESSSWTSTNPRDLDLRADNPFDGDEDEFARFRRLLIDLEEDHEWSDGQGEGKRRFDSVEESVSTASSRSASSAPKRIKRSTSGSVPEDVIPRYFLQITVKRCSYATFHAFLEFLYTGEISFLPSHSDFLVHDCDNGRYISESACEHACEIWLQRRAPRTVPAPCSPQAVYCLADRYLMDDLKKRAKRFLVSSLTVENVAYEAFSSLSVDLKDYQQPVLDFLLKNWDEVKNSRAMQNVRYLLALGDLSDAAPILGKIFDRLSFDKGKDEKVGQEKG